MQKITTQFINDMNPLTDALRIFFAIQDWTVEQRIAVQVSDVAWLTNEFSQIC